MQALLNYHFFGGGIKLDAKLYGDFEGFPYNNSAFSGLGACNDHCNSSSSSSSSSSSHSGVQAVQAFDTT